MNFLFLANFKSHKTTQEVDSWLKQVAPYSQGVNLVVAPSSPHLHLLASYPSLSACSQDVSPFPVGSYTGATNATQLKDLSVAYSIIGHSERRKYFHETSSEIARKLKELLLQDITPILCLSKSDIEPQLATLSDQEISRTIFAYEPPADIGGTETAPLEDIEKTTKLLKSLTSNRPVVYGGSVNAHNLPSLLPLGVSGVLVATASLNPTDFLALLNAYKAQQE